MAKKHAKPTKAHCPTCDGERICEVHGTTSTSWDWEDRLGNFMHGGADHSLVQCRGCETVFYQSSSWDSEDINQWYGRDGEAFGEYVRTVNTYPKPESKMKPPWVSPKRLDRQLIKILDETYSAFENQSYILTAVGLRTAIDRATDLLGIEAAKTFTEKLDELQSGGWIGDTEKEILGVVIDAGSAAAHRGWSPDAEDATQLITVMEVFLQKAFIVEKKALGLKASIPPKPLRVKTLKIAAPAPKPAAKKPVAKA